MSRTGEDNWYFEKYSRYLKYAHTEQTEKDYTSYKIKEKIIKVVEEIFSSEILSDLFPKSIDIDNEFFSKFKDSVVENELQQMYEFLKFSKSYYLTEEIAPYAITHEIMYQSLHNDGKNDISYCFRYANGSLIDIQQYSVPKHEKDDDINNKNTRMAECEEEFYSEKLSTVKQTITNRITQNIKSENIITPYKTYLIDEETDFIYKNYCKLFMEIYRPFSEDRIKEWINPTSILKKDKNTFCIAYLIQNYDESINNSDILNKETQNDKLSEQIEIIKYQEKILCAISSIIKLYDNTIYTQFPNTFDNENLWKDNIDLEWYLLEKIFGLECITYLCKLDLSDEEILAIAMLLNPISTMGFNSLHKFIINILKNVINENMAKLLINITIHAHPIDEKYYNYTLGDIILDFIHFITTLRKLIDKTHRILVGDFVKYIKKKRTYEKRKSYFKEFDKYISIEFDRDDIWKTLDENIKSDKKYLLCGLLYNKINYSSNRRIVDDEGVHIVDKKKRYGRSDDIEGCMSLLYSLTIDQFLLYTDDMDDDN